MRLKATQATSRSGEAVVDRSETFIDGDFIRAGKPYANGRQNGTSQAPYDWEAESFENIVAVEGRRNGQKDRPYFSRVGGYVDDIRSIWSIASSVDGTTTDMT